jgi:hypothetical protein
MLVVGVFLATNFVFSAAVICHGYHSDVCEWIEQAALAFACSCGLALHVVVLHVCMPHTQ